MPMMNKISATQAGQMMKMAAENLRALSEEKVSVAKERDELKSECESLREKVASIEREQRIVKVAKTMEEKGLNTGLSLEEKIENLREKGNLDVIEEAVNMQAPQLKLASVVEDGKVQVEGNSDSAADTFAATLLSDD
jgi:predicted nuclease with TOPRIM domain